MAAIAPCFEYFRIVRLDVDQYSNSNGVTHFDSDILNVTLGMLEGKHAVSFEPSDAVRTGVPTGLNEMAQAAQFMAGSSPQRIGFRVRKRDLLGTPLKWWNTASTGASTDALVQGIVWTYTFNNNTNDSTNAPAVDCIVSGIIEFKGMIAPTLSMFEEQKKVESTMRGEIRKPPSIVTVRSSQMTVAELRKLQQQRKREVQELDVTIRARLADESGWQDTDDVSPPTPQ